jgi:hypothetical protein
LREVAEKIFKYAKLSQPIVFRTGRTRVKKTRNPS